MPGGDGLQLRRYYYCDRARGITKAYQTKPLQGCTAGKPCAFVCRVGIIDLRELFRVTAVTESQPGGFFTLASIECRVWLLELYEEQLPHRRSLGPGV